MLDIKAFLSLMDGFAAFIDERVRRDPLILVLGDLTGGVLRLVYAYMQASVALNLSPSLSAYTSSMRFLKCKVLIDQEPLSSNISILLGNVNIDHVLSDVVIT